MHETKIVVFVSLFLFFAARSFFVCSQPVVCVCVFFKFVPMACVFSRLSFFLFFSKLQIFYSIRDKTCHFCFVLFFAVRLFCVFTIFLGCFFDRTNGFCFFCIFCSIIVIIITFLKLLIEVVYETKCIVVFLLLFCTTFLCVHKTCFFFFSI